MKTTKEATAESREFLLSVLKPGMTLNTILRHRSRSGMSREISVLIGDKDITWHVARFMQDRIGKHDGIVVSGCGMDMGFHLVYSLSSQIFDGFHCIGENCPGSDHSNPPYPKRDGTMIHRNGGYALSQRWL